MELVYDGEINVKCAAIRLVFRIIDCFSPETKANRISMLFIELLSSINEEVLKVISKEIGFILSKVFYHLFSLKYLFFFLLKIIKYMFFLLKILLKPLFFL